MSTALKHKISKSERVGRMSLGHAAIEEGTAWGPVTEELAVLARLQRARRREASDCAMACALNRDQVSTKRGGKW